MTWRVLLLDLIAAIALTVAAVSERLVFAVAGLLLWVLVFVVATATRRPTPPGWSGAARGAWPLWCWTGLPAVIGLAAISMEISPAPGPAIASGVVITVTAALVAVPTRVLVARWRKPRPPSPLGRRPVIAAVCAAVLVATLPVAVHREAERRLERRVRPCPRMAAYAGDHVPLALKRDLAQACDLRAAGPEATAAVAGSGISVYGPVGDAAGIAADAAAMHEHHTRLLGAPATPPVEVYSVEQAGDIRGRAGPGYVLIDPVELRDRRDCARFRRTAGVEGACGQWVLAHEVAHQWFRWTAFDGSLATNAAVTEGTSDYVVWRWWRESYGTDDAVRLALELFDGRLDLARGFAGAYPPGFSAPEWMSDAQGRAFTYGRASAAWVAVDRAVGADRAADALRAVLAAGRSATDLAGVLAAVREAVPEAEPILRTWWTDPTFVPRL